MADPTPTVTTVTDVSPGYVLNMDIPFLHAKLNDIIIELDKSGDSVLWPLADRDRFASYLDAIESDINYLAAQPILDLPKVRGRRYPLEADPALQPCENQDILYVVRLVVALRDEVINSDSNRLANAVLDYDKAKWLAVVQKLRNFMTDYEAKHNPMDLPASSPETPLVTPGQRGVDGTPTTAVSVSPV